LRFRAIRVSGIALACVIAAASVAQAQSTLYTSKPAFIEALATTPTEIGFDNLPSGALAGNEFQHLGVTIQNVDGHPIRVASWTASGNLEIPTRPNAISSSYVGRPEPGFSLACCGVYFNNAASDHIRMVFATPATAAGIHLGQNDFRGVTLTWYGIDGTVIRTHNAAGFNPGNGFVGLVSQDTPIAALVVHNAANDGDGMFFDDLVFARAPLPRAGAVTAYVANSGGNTVSVIDAITQTVTATIVVGLAPAAIVPTPDGRFLYVTNSGDNSVSVIDAATHIAVASIWFGTGAPRHLGRWRGRVCRQYRGQFDLRDRDGDEYRGRDH
jgi:YVTN family beta-propeller protein